MIQSGHCEAVVLRWGRYFCGPGDLWQGLETFSVALMGVSWCPGAQVKSAARRLQSQQSRRLTPGRTGFAGVGTRRPSFQFPPLQWECLFSIYPTAILTRLASQIRSWRGICQDESYPDSATCDERSQETLGSRRSRWRCDELGLLRLSGSRECTVHVRRM